MPGRHSLLLGALLVASFLIYLPGVSGPYQADDFPNLVDNPRLLLDSFDASSLKDAAFSSRSGPTYRPLAMLSFALNYSLAGNTDATSVKLINIFLHLLAGILIYALSVSLLPQLRGTGLNDMHRARTLALLTTAFWLLHPLFVSTVLYSVQRMSILSAIFVMAGCLFYARRRPRLTGGRDCLVLLVGIAALTILGTLCKENAALLPGFLLLIECTVFRFRFAGQIGRGWRAALIAATAVPALLVLVYLVTLYVGRGAQEVPGYDFTIHERLLTQFRVLTQYAGWLSLVNPEPLGLYHDDFPYSRGLLRPPSTLVFLVFWLAAAFAGAIMAFRRRIEGFALSWFMWGHALESSVIPLAPVFEHRNYLPGYGLILLLAVLWQRGTEALRIEPRWRLAILVFVLVALPGYQTAERVRLWGDEASLIVHSLQRQPESAFTLLAAAVYLGERGELQPARSALHEAQRANPNEPALVFAEASLHCAHEREHAFVEPLRLKLLEHTRSRLRSAAGRHAFARMARSCAGSPANDDTLLTVYEGQRHAGYETVAVASLFGIGAVYLHRRDLAAAREAWEAAERRSGQGRIIRPWIDELNRWQSAGERK